MARRRTRRIANITLNRYKLGALLLFLGGLFFFSQQMADQSPIFIGLSYPTTQMFGEKGSFVFFGMLAIIGLLILVRQKYYTRRLFKFGIIALILVCGILNFPLLEHGVTNVSGAGFRDLLLSNGGRLGYIVLRALNRAFGGEAQAIKIVMIVLLVTTGIAVAVYYKIKLPTLRFEAVTEGYQSVKSAVKQARATAQEEKATHTESAVGSSKTPEKKDDSRLLKSLLKEKISQKIQQKEDEQTIRQLHVSFPKDKPTFSLNLLHHEPNIETGIDETRLMEKAQAIKNKLSEFDVDISLE